eukprot:scaffold7951_cov80-Skeletonema_marinoi.AAC.5
MKAPKSRMNGNLKSLTSNQESDIDNTVVYEGSSMFWVSPQLTIEPGKRQVTFRLVKNLPNPNEVPLDLGPSQVWLDKIVFTANS